MSVENNKISIIGGSIAGLSCGIRIKQLAINKIKHVTLYEARVKGREKCCGGLLTQKAYNYLEEMLKADVLEQCVKSKVERFDIYENYTKLFSSTSYHPIRICDRAELDLALTNRFIELGGEYLDNIRVEQDTIEKLKYQNDIILDATGCNIKEGKNGFGIEYTLKRKTINDTSFERDDYLDINGFFQFFIDAILIEKKVSTVWDNIKAFDYRYDLKKLNEPLEDYNNDDDYRIMPRYILSNEQKFFDIIFNILILFLIYKLIKIMMNV